MNRLDSFLDERAASSSVIKGVDRGAGVVVSSRIRLARNLEGAAFPAWAGARERLALFERISGLLEESGGLNDPESLRVDALDPVVRDVLKERHLISSELVEGGKGSGVVYDRQGTLSVMINEEDHLRLQSLRSGLELHQAWGGLDRLDSLLERHIRYAFSPRLGYLTACPSNVGTGMRASVMLHLAGLRLLGEAEQVIRGLNRTGFAVRGAFGEGSDAFGSLYQVSNQVTLGMREQGILTQLENMVKVLVQIEQNARWRLLGNSSLRFRDHVARLLGVWQNARLLSAGEGMDILSGLSLGLEYELIGGIDQHRLSEAMRRIQSGHLQQEARQLLTTGDRDAFRAGFLRGLLTGVVATGNL